MKKLKCESCGGLLKVDETGEYASCDYCKTTYKLNEDHTVTFKMDDNMKGSVETGFKAVKAVSIVGFIIPMVIGIIVFAGIIGLAIYMKGDSSPIKKSEFNRTYERDAGTKQKIFIALTLDNVVTNNKTNSKHLIAVEYSDKSTTKPEEIIEIKKSLDNFREYEVSFEYDSDGYINKMIIKK